MSPRARDEDSASCPAPRITPRLAASSRSSAAAPAKAARIGPNFTLMRPFTELGRALADLGARQAGRHRRHVGERLPDPFERVLDDDFVLDTRAGTGNRGHLGLLVPKGFQRQGLQRQERRFQRREAGRRLRFLVHHRGFVRRAARLNHRRDRTHDADVAGAAAQVARHLHADAPLVRAGQRAARGRAPRSACPACRSRTAARARARTRRAARAIDRVVVEAFDRAHLAALAGDRVGDARAHRLRRRSAPCRRRTRRARSRGACR